MRRSGYTLLEVLLALSIALMLLGGLYVSMESQLNYAQSAREKVDEAALARALLTRIGADVASSLTPIRSAAGAATAAAATTDSAAATATATASAAPVTPTTTATTASTTDTEGTTELMVVQPLNGGVVGELFRLVLFTNRVPKQPKAEMEGEAVQGLPDVRRVTYWLAGDQGLARQEVSRVTADDESTALPPDVNNEVDFVIAPEVTFLEFSFFDGTTWSETWDGTSIGEDGATPIGPPRAVAIIIEIKTAAMPNPRRYRHVVAIQAANAQPMTTTPEEELP